MDNKQKMVDNLLTHMGQQARQQHFDDAVERGEMRLRTHVYSDQPIQQKKIPMKKTFFSRKWFMYGGGAVAIVLLAFVTVSGLKSNISTATSTSLSSSTSNSGISTSYSDVSASLGESDSSSFFNSLNKPSPLEEEYVQPQPEYQQQYTYTDEEGEQQAYKTDVALRLEIEENPLGVIDQIQTQILGVDGVVLSTSYNASNHSSNSGNVAARIPLTQLSEFQQQLTSLDANAELEILSYNVQNVSQQVARYDEQVEQAERLLKEYRERLEAASTSYEKNIAKQNIQQEKEEIERLEEVRSEVVAQYDYATVSITLADITKQRWDDLRSIDTTTFWGEIHYEVVDALGSLVDTLSGFTLVIIWVIVYGIVIVPAFLGLRALVRAVNRRRYQ